jgi:hypothetical protein
MILELMCEEPLLENFLSLKSQYQVLAKSCGAQVVSVLGNHEA